MPFGQLVVGPPGSGKTTYCAGLQHFFELTGRHVAVVNLDPANDSLSYDCAVDIRDLVYLEAVQETLSLGPNGGLIYCMEYLEANLDWLQERLAPLAASGSYFLFDCPGQVELFTLHTGMKRIIQTLTNSWNYRLAAVQLVDAHLCSDPAKYLAALLQSLSTMLHLELPHVNVLSKFDAAEQYGELAFRPDFYLRAQGLEKLADAAAELLPPKFTSLTRGLCELVEDYGLVAFSPLAIEDKESVAHLVALIDKSNGFAFAGLARKSTGEGPPAIPPELQYGMTVPEDPEDVWSRMAERYRIARGVLERETHGNPSDNENADVYNEHERNHKTPTHDVD